MQDAADGGLAPGARLARTTFYVIAGGLAAQLLYNLANYLLGGSYPYTWFGFNSDDRWGDFFKVAFGYPGEPIHPPLLNWHAQPHIHHLWQMAHFFIGPHINSDHMPPVETTLALLVRRGFTVTDPFILFQVVLWGTFLAIAITIHNFGPKGNPHWVMAALLSYPVWYVFDRGHFFSLICATALVAGCRRLIEARDRMDWVGIGLLALACNMRPNVVLIPALLVLSGRAGRFRDLVALGFAGIVTLEAFMLIAGWLYPHYGWVTWINGLQDYKMAYIDKPLTRGFTSSLASALTVLFGYRSTYLLIGQIIGLASLGAALYLGRKDRLGTAEVVFVAMAAMVISTPVLADYHLLPFLLPLLLMGRLNRALVLQEKIVAVTCLIVLIPKNFIYGDPHVWDPWSIQVVINPAVLLIALGSVLYVAWRGAGADEGASPGELAPA